MRGCPRVLVWMLIPALLLPAGGCRSPRAHREQADRIAYEIIAQKQVEGVGEADEFTVEPPEVLLRERLLRGQELPFAYPASLGSDALEPVPHWPERARAASTNAADRLPWVLTNEVARIGLDDALVISARSSRDYQQRKEQLFTVALALDLERDAFRNTFNGLLSALVSTDGSGEERVTGVETAAELGLTRRFLTGAELTGRIAVDLVKLLTLDKSSAYGIFGDASVSIPLLRGAGRHIAGEPLTQAERDVLYAVWDFERFKRTFAVRVAGDYLGILQQLDQLKNAEQNYRSLLTSLRRANRLSEAGRLPKFQVDQVMQDVLRSRTGWIRARQAYARQLDDFKVLLGLPADARIELDPEAIERLQSILDGMVAADAEPDLGDMNQPASAPVEIVEPSLEGAGPMEFEEAFALEVALANRLDLRTAADRVEDAQRKVVVAANALLPEATLGGSAQAGERRALGSADAGDAEFSLSEGSYAGFLNLDLGMERTAERNVYRRSLLALEQAVRDYQALEDQVKVEIRSGLRDLLESRENLTIQAQAVELAMRRVHSTDMFLDAGRAETRDVLDAQNDLLTARNALTSALVSYRLAELGIQRDMGVLGISAEGLWEEFEPERPDKEGHEDTEAILD